MFLLSDLRFKLAQCADPTCGRYFLLTLRRKHVYKRGTFCSHHRRAERQKSALVSTARGREKASKELFTIVAKRFRCQIECDPLWHRKATKKAITSHLNAEITNVPHLQRPTQTD